MPEERAAANLTLPRIEYPPDEPVTSEEIARRRALFAKVMALREETGPIGIPADELVHQARREDDASFE